MKNLNEDFHGTVCIYFPFFSICLFLDLPRVQLHEIESLFWRYQRGNPATHLATIEAIYHFTVLYHKHFLQKEYSGEYDNLLFFFRFMFQKIRTIYDPNSLRAYVGRPHLL